MVLNAFPRLISVIVNADQHPCTHNSTCWSGYNEDIAMKQTP
jgi:hypothetical protein